MSVRQSNVDIKETEDVHFRILDISMITEGQKQIRSPTECMRVTTRQESVEFTVMNGQAKEAKLAKHIEKEKPKM
jgi:hypothetical protein